MSNAWDEFVAEQRKDSEFAAGMDEERAKIDRYDQLARESSVLQSEESCGEEEGP